MKTLIRQVHQKSLPLVTLDDGLCFTGEYIGEQYTGKYTNASHTLELFLEALMYITMKLI
ncbi:hypothetical protein T4C_12994 [Trichinella pseudospiralis]|uniref:Uncharacterized protein n=1 Tax=Trichinella pseudospiralis TaxID=6337 RepID=A0A0V1JWK9_TRIPS|nr:hypothetical protein T4C_12994 [Trichinella pseudospiralis]